MASDAIIQATADSFAADVTGAPGLTLVDFWAPWCGPCRAVAPILDEIAEAYTGRVRVVKVNTDDERNLARQHNVMSIPTLMLFHEENLLERMVGMQSKETLSDVLDRYLDQIGQTHGTDAKQGEEAQEEE